MWKTEITQNVKDGKGSSVSYILTGMSSCLLGNAKKLHINGSLQWKNLLFFNNKCAYNPNPLLQSSNGRGWDCPEHCEAAIRIRQQLLHIQAEERYYRLQDSWQGGIGDFEALLIPKLVSDRTWVAAGWTAEGSIPLPRKRPILRITMPDE